MGNESSAPFDGDDKKEKYGTILSQPTEHSKKNGDKKASRKDEIKIIIKEQVLHPKIDGNSNNNNNNKNGPTSSNLPTNLEEATNSARKIYNDLSTSVTSTIEKMDTSNLLDTMCGPFLDGDRPGRTASQRIISSRNTGNINGSRSYNSIYSDDFSEENTEYTDDQTMDSSYASSHQRRDRDSTGHHPGHRQTSRDTRSMLIQSDVESNSMSYVQQQKVYRKDKKGSVRVDSSTESHSNADSEDNESYPDDKIHTPISKSLKTSEITAAGGVSSGGLSKPLASSFAKRCYFTKAGIGNNTQHYEGLTLTGNVVLMLASAMKLKGCPTICDEDLRRVEQTYPNQFSRLPDELLLSSGWRRISKSCHFSNKPIPDGLPFFHSKQRLHPSTGGYYFLLAGAVGMVRPIDVEPLTRDTLVLLETDYPIHCDAAPEILIQDPNQWTLVDKFCFFSGGPINTKEDVYYQADFDGNPIYMLAFLSPSLTPEELYKLGGASTNSGKDEISDSKESSSGSKNNYCCVEEPGLKSIAAVEDVESVYDLTERDFDDLKLYHLGPCRALPQYMLQPHAWTKVLPPHFLTAKKKALLLAQEYERGSVTTVIAQDPPYTTDQVTFIASPLVGGAAWETPRGETSVPRSSSQPQQLSILRQQCSTDPGGPLKYPLREYFHQQSAHHNQQPPPPPLPPPRQFMPVAGLSPGLNYPYYEQEPRQHQVLPSRFATDSMTNEHNNLQREIEEEGAFVSCEMVAPIDEALDSRARRLFKNKNPGNLAVISRHPQSNRAEAKADPPDDEPPSLSRNIDTFDNEQSIFPISHLHKQRQIGGYDEVSSYQDASKGKTHFVEVPPPEVYFIEGEYYDSPDNKTHHVSCPIEYHSSENLYYDSSRKNFELEKGLYYYDVDEKQEERAKPELKPQQLLREDVLVYTSPNDTSSKSPPKEQPHSRSDIHLSYVDVLPQSDNFAVPAENNEHNGIHYDEKPSFIIDNQTTLLPTATSEMTDHGCSPKSGFSSKSNFSSTSAMRGAHELIKKNRQRRLDRYVRKQQNHHHLLASGPEDEIDNDGKSQATWETGSDFTSVVSGSSVWTDTSNTDRSSRRALILQMAKARMKSNKGADECDRMKSGSYNAAGKGPAPIQEEESVNSVDLSSPRRAQELNCEIDLTGDLD